MSRGWWARCVAGLLGGLSLTAASSCDVNSNAGTSGSPGPVGPGGQKTQIIAPGTVWDASHHTMAFTVTATSVLTGSFETHPEQCNSWVGPPTLVPCPNDPHEAVVLDPDNYALYTESRSYTYPGGCDTGRVATGIFTTSCVLAPGNYYVVVSGKYGAIDWPQGLTLTTTGG